MSETTETVKPVVGMGVTEIIGSDRYAGTITRVHKNGKMFWFKHDDAKLIEGSCMSEYQVYEYTPNPNMPEQCAKHSRCRIDAGKNRFHNQRLTVILNVRRSYRDPSF